MIGDVRNLLGFIRSRLPVNDYHPLFVGTAGAQEIVPEIHAYDGNGMLFALTARGAYDADPDLIFSAARPNWIDYYELVEVGVDFAGAPRWHEPAFVERDDAFIDKAFGAELAAVTESDEEDPELVDDYEDDLPSTNLMAEWRKNAQPSRPSFGKKLLYVSFVEALAEPNAEVLTVETLNERRYRLARSQKAVDRTRSDIRRAVGLPSSRIWQADDQIVVTFNDRRVCGEIISGLQQELRRSCVIDYLVAELISVAVSDVSGLSPLSQWMSLVERRGRP